MISLTGSYLQINWMLTALLSIWLIALLLVLYQQYRKIR